MRVYLASHARNDQHGFVLRALQAVGHEVYSAEDLAPILLPPQPDELTRHDEALAKRGAELARTDAVVVIEPSGRAAAFAIGFAYGLGKPTCVMTCTTAPSEPLYALGVDYAKSVDGVLAWLAVLAKRRAIAAAAVIASPANLPGWGSLTLVEKIAAVLREARDPGALERPEYFDRRAQLYDLIAEEDERTWEAMPDRTELGRKIVQARKMAEKARKRAEILRAREAPAREAAAS